MIQVRSRCLFDWREELLSLGGRFLLVGIPDGAGITLDEVFGNGQVVAV